MAPNRTPKKSGPGDVAPKTPASKKPASTVGSKKTPGNGRTSLPNTPGTSSTGGVSKNRKRKFEDKEWNFTHVLPSAKQVAGNGRQEGRNLITWTRPRMAEKLLLHLIYECSRHSIDLPWDAIAHRFHPGSSGGAIIQHLNRMRPTLIAEGHLVPPVPVKPGVRLHVDPAIRGYVRQHQDDPNQLFEARAVRFDEPLEDRRFNLPDAYDNPNIANAAKAGHAAHLGPAVPPPGKAARRTRAAPKTKKSAASTIDKDDSEYNDKGKKPSAAARTRPARAAASAVKYKEAEEEDVLGDCGKTDDSAVAKDDNDKQLDDAVDQDDKEPGAQEGELGDAEQNQGYDGSNEMDIEDYADEEFYGDDAEAREEDMGRTETYSDEEFEAGYGSSHLPRLAAFPGHSLSSPLGGLPSDVISTSPYVSNFSSFGAYDNFGAQFQTSPSYRPSAIFSSPSANRVASRLAGCDDDEFNFDREEAEADRAV